VIAAKVRIMTTLLEEARAPLRRVLDRIPEDDPDREVLDRLAAFLEAKNSLTTSEAAQLLGLGSVNTVKRVLAAGLLEGATQTAGRHWRIPVEAVARYREDQLALRAAGSLKPSRARIRRHAATETLY